MPLPERGPFSRENLPREVGFAKGSVTGSTTGSKTGNVRPAPLRLATAGAATGVGAGAATGVGAGAASGAGAEVGAGGEHASVPAGTASGVADQDNPLRIDAYAAIAATLDPSTRAVFEEAVATLKALKLGREQVEAKLKETGREDAIRAVTGTSALDAAIERTEAIIRHLGQMRQLADEAERI
jgi:hypothetical protein